MPKQSVRFGVTSSSRTGSAIGRSSAAGVPGAGPSPSTRIPSWPSPSSSSFSEQIIPLDSTPRSFACLIFIPPGITAPGRATTTVCPAATFGAPQTIVRAPSPASTWQTFSRSASGCFETSCTFPITKPSAEGGPRVTTRSTSVPVIAICSARTRGSRPGSQ